MVQRADEPKSAAAKSVPPEARGDELVLSSGQDTEQLVCARGSLFLVTERHGNVAPKGARELGLFYQDTRYLSHFELHVANVELTYLSADTSHDAFNQVDLMVSGIDEGEFLDDPQNFLHIRRRQLLENSLIEQIELTNFLSRSVTLDLELRFESDFADIFEVRGAKRKRRGTSELPQTTSSSVTHSYNGLDGVRYSTEFSFAPAPSTLTPGSAKFKIELAAGGVHCIEVHVVPRRNAAATTVRSTLPFDQRSARQLEQTHAFREDSMRVRCSHAVLERVLDQAVADLCAMRVDVGSSSIIAAGIPWFCCPFGRDSLLTSYEALTLNPELAAQSLRVLASFQGTRDNDVNEEEPGKILHELRFGEMANTGEMPHSPYFGSVDSTPLFVVLMDATYRVTADINLVRELRAPLLAALAWIDQHSDDGRTLVAYRRKSSHGLDNQGWKDSRAGVSFPDGRRSEPPIALCEVQGYCVDAYARGARLLQALGDEALSVQYETRAATLAAITNERLWLPDQQRFAFAIDGRGRAVNTVVSNLGHLLWSRIATPAQALATADLLLSSPSFSGFGIRTLATGQAVYNPLSYHNGTVWPHDNAIIAKGFANYGLTEHAARVFEGLIDAMRYFHDRRLPELFCGMPQKSGNLVRYPVACSPQAWASAAPFLLLQATLGIHIDAPRSQLDIRNARLPACLDWLELNNLRVGASRVSLRMRRGGKRVHVERLEVTGPSIRTSVELE